MVNHLKLKSQAIGAVLLCAALGSSAMTLGRIRGNVLIGQPLDLSIQVQFDAEESAASLCMEADVFHADTRQDPNRVKVTVENALPAQTATVRVTSPQIVDEPMVTVYLKAGCGQKITRRYVLLADYPSEPAPIAGLPVGQTSPVAPPSVTLPPVGGAVALAGSAGSAGETRIGSAWAEASKPAPPVAKPPEAVAAKPIVRKERPPVAAPVKASEASPEKVATVEKKQAGRAAGQSRLRLDPLEVLAERVAMLESSKAVAPPPVDDVVKDAMRFQSLEGDVKALLALAAKNEANLLDMKTRLQKAESERFANWLVYALLAAVLVCLGAVLLMWNRQRAVMASKGDWWRGDASGSEKAGTSPNAHAATTAVALETSAATMDVFDRNPEYAGAASAPPSPKVFAPVSTVDLHLSEISASAFDTLMESGPATMRDKIPAKPDAVPKAGPPRTINSEELFDIRQQADFFVSLGQTDQAIRVLENHIAENAESSPILYLDLLQLFHSLSLKTDFRQFREDFNLLFNAHVPEFAQFKQDGQGLEAYPEILSGLSALWSSPKVLDLIEGYIFRNVWDDRGQSIDLAAFRELLLLHAIAQSEHEVAGDARTGSARSSALGRGALRNERVVSGFGAMAPRHFPNTRQATQLDGGAGPDTDLDAYLTRSEPPLPSIDAALDIDLDIDLNVEESARQPNGRAPFA